MSMQPFPQKQADYPPHVVHGTGRNPLIPEAWVITFGLDHPLASRYVRIEGDEESARKLATRIFGPGNWAGIYAEAAGRASRAIDRGHLTELNLGLNRHE